MNTVTVIGLMAATLTTFAFLPQAVKVWRTKSTRDISLIMFSVMTTGIVLWLIYGVLIWDLPLIYANAVTLPMAAYVLFAKMRYG